MTLPREMGVLGPGILAPGTPQGYVPDDLLPVTRFAISPAYVQSSNVGSPAWYFGRLMARLDVRAEALLVWEAYYAGDQPLAFASDKFRQAFGGRFRAFASNFCALVVDGTRERMEVTGFRFPSARSTTRAWRIWQDNDMDGGSQIALTDALVKGISYLLVEPPTPVLGGSPRITVESALDAIVDCDPRDRRSRRAGMKRYVADDGHLIVYLYTPEFVWRLRSVSPWRRDDGGQSAAAGWEPWPEPGEEWPMRNRLGAVPLVALPNRPRLHVDGVSEIQPVMSNQDAINKYRADALVAAEFAAFRQRWATGLDIPEDPNTGQPVEPFKAAVDRLWVVPPPDPENPNATETHFGEFEATDLAPYQQMIESEVGAMSSISRMPYHYLLGQPASVPPSGESLKSSEAGLVAKVRAALIHFGEGFEETMRLCLLAVGDPGARDRTSETLWRDPETRNEATRTDAAVKLKSANIATTEEARVMSDLPAVPVLGTLTPATAPAPPAQLEPADESGSIPSTAGVTPA